MALQEPPEVGLPLTNPLVDVEHGYDEEAAILAEMGALRARTAAHCANVARRKVSPTQTTAFLGDVVKHLPASPMQVATASSVISANLQRRAYANSRAALPPGLIAASSRAPLLSLNPWQDIAGPATLAPDPRGLKRAREHDDDGGAGGTPLSSRSIRQRVSLSETPRSMTPVSMFPPPMTPPPMTPPSTTPPLRMPMSSAMSPVTAPRPVTVYRPGADPDALPFLFLSPFPDHYGIPLQMYATSSPGSLRVSVPMDVLQAARLRAQQQLRYGPATPSPTPSPQRPTPVPASIVPPAAPAVRSTTTPPRPHPGTGPGRAIDAGIASVFPTRHSTQWHSHTPRHQGRHSSLRSRGRFPGRV